jgi:hypothetical protein
MAAMMTASNYVSFTENVIIIISSSAQQQVSLKKREPFQLFS